jgi:hypothetical protein
VKTATLFRFVIAVGIIVSAGVLSHAQSGCTNNQADVNCCGTNDYIIAPQHTVVGHTLICTRGTTIAAGDRPIFPCTREIVFMRSIIARVYLTRC